MSASREHKFLSLDLKEVSKDGEITGYASVFEKVDSGNDLVKRGAFRASLAARTPKMLWQHDPHQPIGHWTDVVEDDHGLRVTGRVLSTIQKGSEVLEMMRAKIVDGLSIGFRTLKASRDERTGVRSLIEVDLWEISVVTFPMLDVATVETVKGTWTKRDVERTLRDAGMPNAMAVKLISGGWAAATTADSQRDAGPGSNDILASLRAATDIMRR